MKKEHSNRVCASREKKRKTGEVHEGNGGNSWGSRDLRLPVLGRLFRKKKCLFCCISWRMQCVYRLRLSNFFVVVNVIVVAVSLCACTLVYFAYFWYISWHMQRVCCICLISVCTRVYVCVYTYDCAGLSLHPHTHTHTHIYIYIYEILSET